MAEKQKESSSSAKSTDKTSLLDMDIGNDFLTSWKSMSVADDDPMDFDFSKIAKGNKKAFNFDNVNIDFNLDADFGKLSSFNLDMPDLDVSSPIKKSAKPTEKSKEVSTDGKTPRKSDRLTFQFDFNEFEDISFGPSFTKKAKQTSANKDAEISASLSGSLGLGIQPKETITAAEEETASKFDSQLGAPNFSSKERPQESLTEEHFPSKSEMANDQATNTGSTPLLEKPISNSTQQPYQDNFPKDGPTLPEPHAKEKYQKLSIQSVSENSSNQQTASHSQEEVSCLSIKERIHTGSEQSIVHKKADFGIDRENRQMGELPVDMPRSHSSNNENSQLSGDNPVPLDGKDNAGPAQGDSQFEQTLTTSASKKMLLVAEANVETMNMTSELVMQLSSGTTGDKHVSDSTHSKEVIRSKYFKVSDEAKLQLQQPLSSPTKIATFESKKNKPVQLSPADEGATISDNNAMPDSESSPRSESVAGLDVTNCQLQQGSLSQVKFGAIGSQRINTMQPSTADENENAQSGSKLVALSRPKSLSKGQTKGDLVQVKPSDVTSDRVCIDSYDTMGNMNNTSTLHDMDVPKGGSVLDGSENNMKGLNTFKKVDNNDAKTGTKSVVLPKAILREQIEEGSVQARSQGSPRELNSNSIGRTLTGTSRLHEKDAVKGSHVGTSSLKEQTIISASLLGKNPKLPSLGMKSIHNKSISLDNRKISSLKDGTSTSVLSNLNMRTTETTHPPSNSTLKKDAKLLTNYGQGVDLKEYRGSRMVHHVDTRKQAQLSPTLKRKKIEESTANLLMVKSPKRLYESPRGSRNFKEPSPQFVNKNMPDSNIENALSNSQGSSLYIPQNVDMQALETLSAVDNETNVENAEACAKELDDLANMLKKKHEEAKEILVRAVVNNNKLLMLNHPKYEEKFRMIEKFAALKVSAIDPL